MDPRRCWNYSIEILVHVHMTALQNSSSFFLFYHIPKVFNWIQNQKKKPLKNSEHIVMVMKPVCDRVHYHAKNSQ